ncbi:hypothetical protein BDZ89DRAFT_1064563 [Hymenopellis radicata]|nr:hypothetical protein BDZ89DRAFT_1064563 [Hymenopellis radicata]
MLCKAKSAVAALEKRIIEVDSVLQNAKKISHPIRSIPNEILSMIFAQCANTHFWESRDEKDSLSTERAPWNLSYVCQRWRNLVLSSPSLWSSPSFNFALYENRPLRWVIYLATLYMERSERLSLSVELIANETRQLCNHPLTFVIEATTLRWETVVFDCPLPILRLFAGCTFPLLETVRTGLWFVDDDEEQGPQITTLSSLPRLSRLISATDELYGMVHLPWNRIVFYQCDFHAFQDLCSKALGQIASLQSLVVTLSSEFAITAPDIVVLPRLTDLQIRINNSPALAVIDQFLASLSMSSLKRLHLHYLPCIGVPVFPSVHPDFSHVDSLHVCANLVKLDKELIAFLSIMGGVEELQISWGLLAEGLVRSLTPSCIGTNAPLLPRLRVLDVHRSWIFWPPSSPYEDVSKAFDSMVIWRASSTVSHWLQAGRSTCAVGMAKR